MPHSVNNEIAEYSIHRLLGYHIIMYLKKLKGGGHGTCTIRVRYVYGTCTIRVRYVYGTCMVHVRS